MDRQPPSSAEREARKRALLTEKLLELGFDESQANTLLDLRARRATWVTSLEAVKYMNDRVKEWYDSVSAKYPNAYNHALVHEMFGSTAFQGVNKFDLPGDDSVLKFADTLEAELREKGMLTRPLSR